MKGADFQCDVPAGTAPGYSTLRDEFLELIRDYCGGTWTDHNVHDPGITLAELLCFGITDANHVAGLPMADLLVAASGSPPPPSPNFPAHAVLPCRPLTSLDYRKLVIDHDGVRNAWVEIAPAPPPKVYVDQQRRELSLTPPVDGCELALRGFYRVLVEFEDSVPEADVPGRLAAIRATLEARRNLCEVFLAVEQVVPEEVAVCAEISVAEDADLEEVAARAYLALGQHLAPPLRFRSLDEELTRGTAIDTLFQGPLLEHGFLDDAEIQASERPDEVRASDLVQVLMDVEGVLAIGKVVMTSYRDGVVAHEGERWVLPLDPDRAPRLSVSRSRLLFYKRELPFLASAPQVAQRLAELRALDATGRQPPATLQLPVPVGRRRALDSFETLLNLLPPNYGVGTAGLSPDAPPDRQARARQLKAYFLLAEWFLSAHRDQVSRLAEQLSLWRQAPVLSSQPPSDLRDFADIAGRSESRLAADTRSVVEPETERLRRRNAIADHLLARFAEPFDPYVLVSTGRAAAPDPLRLLADKLRFLAALPGLAHDRAAAIDLTLDPARRGNLSGLERRLHALLGTAPALASALEVYDEQDDDGVVEWRFRIRDATGKILLSSSRHYLSRDAAEAEIAAVAAHAPVAERYVDETDNLGRFYFNLVDEHGEVIARRIEFFATAGERDDAVRACVEFFQGLPPGIEFHLLEHILLRPRAGAARLLPICHPEDATAAGCPCDDPYSFRLTVVLPAWNRRLRGIYFREHFERLIREQTPAHLFVKICWVSEAQMAAFRTAWTAWRVEYARDLSGQASQLARAQDDLIAVWLQLRSQFPPATLHDCVDGNDENPVVLDKSLLGTLSQEPLP